VRRYENRREGRYYLAWAGQDLFGQWCVTRVWGGIGTERGRLTVEPRPGQAECLAELASIERRRAKRGYSLVSESTAEGGATS
jgi:predicted DNA-binding WGR domain protein